MVLVVPLLTVPAAAGAAAAPAASAMSSGAAAPAAMSPGAVSPGAASAGTASPAVRGTDLACPAPRVPVGPFTDVDDGAVFARAIDCLRLRGTVAGTSGTTFAPGATITRGQVAVLLARLLRAAEVRLPEPEDRFDDLGDVPGQTRQAVEVLAAVGVVSGRTTTAYEPLAPVRRDQVAALLLRAWDLLGLPAPAVPGTCFDDLGGSVHAARVEQACAAGLVQGVGERRYDGLRGLTRAQLAGTLARLVDVLVEAGRLPALPEVAYRSSTAAVDAAALGASWRPGCPVGPADLVSLRLVHVGFDGRPRDGELVVARGVATQVDQVFRRLHAERFPVRAVRPAAAYGGDDVALMAADVTSAFNCRPVTGGASWSSHSYGAALDLNPRENPYVSGSTVLPSQGRAYLDRAQVRPGMAVEGGPAVTAFDAAAWGWGGRWRSLKDYQHFSASGR